MHLECNQKFCFFKIAVFETLKKKRIKGKVFPVICISEVLHDLCSRIQHFQCVDSGFSTFSVCVKLVV